MKKITLLLVVVTIFLCFIPMANADISSINDEANWKSSAGSWSTVDFDGVTGPVNNQYQSLGVTFGAFNGGTPYTTNKFYHGMAGNSMFTVYPMDAGNGGWAADFATPVGAVSFWSWGVQSPASTVQLFDTSNNLLANFLLLDSGAGHGPAAWGFNGFVSSKSDISRIEIKIGDSDFQDAVWFDDVQFSQVPIPPAIWLLGTGLVGLFGVRRRFMK